MDNMSSISDGIEREKKSVQAFFTENVELEFYDMSRTYCTFKVTGVNGIKPEGTLLVSFYDDLAYISDRDLRDGFAGKLTVSDKVSQYNAESYSRKFRTADCKNPRYMNCPAVGEKVSFVEYLCNAYLHNWAGGRRDVPEDRVVLRAAVALGIAGKFDVDTLPESIEGFVAWMADQAPKPEPVVGKLTDEKLIAELMEDYGWPHEETVNGYGEFTMHGASDYDIDGAVEICRIDDLYMDKRTNYGFDDDWDACRQAEKDGVKFINDIDGLEKGRYVDTPENRAICAAYLHAHPQSRIENWFSSACTTYQNDYVEKFGSPIQGPSIETLKKEQVVEQQEPGKTAAVLDLEKQLTKQARFDRQQEMLKLVYNARMTQNVAPYVKLPDQVLCNLDDVWHSTRSIVCGVAAGEGWSDAVYETFKKADKEFAEQGYKDVLLGYNNEEKQAKKAIEDRIEIDLGFAELVIEHDDPEYKEVRIYLVTDQGDIQDLAEIGQEYSYDEYSDLVFKPSVSVKVYADRNNEDFTHDFSIGLYEGFGLSSRTASLAQSANTPDATPSLNLGDRLAVATVSAEARNTSRQDSHGVKSPSKDQR